MSSLRACGARMDVIKSIFPLSMGISGRDRRADLAPSRAGEADSSESASISGIRVDGRCVSGHASRLGIIPAEMLGDASLDSVRACALAFNPPPLREDLATLLRVRGTPNRGDGVCGKAPRASTD